jgi:hypothetical protein
MCRTLFGYGLSLMILALGASGAAAAVATPMPGQALAAVSAAVPAAMCGYSCRSGGRYIPGPPSVCAEEGLNYCGPSRGPGGAPVVRRDDGYRGYGAPRDEGFGRGCRTITIEREDGSIRRIRRCD